MVVLPGRRSKVLPAVARRCRGRGIPRGADAPLGTYPPQAARQACGLSRRLLPPRPPARRSRASPPAQGSRRSPCLYSSPLDAARSKDGAGPRRLCFARWPLVSSASASGWAAGVGHAGLNGPREERRASALLPFAKRSPTSRRSAALFPPAFGGLRVGARASYVFNIPAVEYSRLHASPARASSHMVNPHALQSFDFNSVHPSFIK